MVNVNNDEIMTEKYYKFVQYPIFIMDILHFDPYYYALDIWNLHYVASVFPLLFFSSMNVYILVQIFAPTRNAWNSISKRQLSKCFVFLAMRLM